MKILKKSLTGQNNYYNYKGITMAKEEFDEDFENEDEDAAGELIVHNTISIQALINLLKKKGIITDKELAAEIDKLDDLSADTASMLDEG